MEESDSSKKASRLLNRHPILTLVAIVVLFVSVLYPFCFFWGYDMVMENEQAVTLYEKKTYLDKAIIVAGLASNDSIVTVAFNERKYIYDKLRHSIQIVNIVPADTLGRLIPILFDFRSATLPIKDSGLTYTGQGVTYFESFRYLADLNLEETTSLLYKSVDGSGKRLLLKFCGYLGVMQGVKRKAREIGQKYYDLNYGYRCLSDTLWWEQTRSYIEHGNFKLSDDSTFHSTVASIDFS